MTIIDKKNQRAQNLKLPRLEVRPPGHIVAKYWRTRRERNCTMGNVNKSTFDGGGQKHFWFWSFFIFNEILSFIFMVWRGWDWMIGTILDPLGPLLDTVKPAKKNTLYLKIMPGTKDSHGPHDFSLYVKGASPLVTCFCENTVWKEKRPNRQIWIQTAIYDLSWAPEESNETLQSTSHTCPNCI